MIQPLSSYGPDGTQDLTYDPDDGPPTSPATRVAVPKPPPMPELPDTDHAALLNMVQAAKSPPPSHMMLAMGVKGEDVEYTVARTPMQKRIDAFKESATPEFSTEEGKKNVAIPFRMAFPPGAYEAMARKHPDSPLVIQESKARANLGALRKAVISVGLGGSFSEIAAGRGTPEQIRRVTQALIEAHRLPPGPTSDLAGRIRTMMCDHGIGLDCAGYVQQAFLASRGIVRSQTGLATITLENLSNLTAKGFKKVPDSKIKEGDLFILGPPPKQSTGHTLIVADARPASPEEAAALVACAARQHLAWANPPASSLRRIELDSSWGNGGVPTAGGVMRRIFWHDEANDRWMLQPSVDPPVWAVDTPDALYFGHPVVGFFRPKQEP